MFVNASETPFSKHSNLCFYVLNIFQRLAKNKIGGGTKISK